MRGGTKPARGVALCTLAILIGCSRGRGAKSPTASDTSELVRMTVHALEADATRTAAEGREAWLSVLAHAREMSSAPIARHAALAAMQGLVGRDVYGLESLGDTVGSAGRVPDGVASVASALDATLRSEGARDPMIRVYAAAGGMRLAAARGDAAAFASSQKASGCATEATVVGPFVGSTLGALADPGPVDGGAIAPQYAPPVTAGNRDLALSTRPVRSAGRGCSLDVAGTARAAGLRYAVIDVTVPKAQRISVGLESASPATLLVEGRVAVSLPYGELGSRATRFGRADVSAAGVVRIVAKVAGGGGDPVSIFVLDEDGAPLSLRAAPVGEAPRANVRAAAPEAESRGEGLARGNATLGAVGSVDDVDTGIVRALGLLAAGDARRAESEVSGIARADTLNKTPPAAALVYARTLVFARDLPAHRRLERMRAAYEAALEKWPNAWEAIVGHAQIVAAQRRGGAGDVEGVADARKHAGAAGEGRVDPLVDAYLAIAGEDIYGVQEEALARVRPRIAKTWLGYRLDRVTTKETTAATAKRDCDPARPDVGRLECARARASVGDDAGVLAEIARLRTLYAAPRLAADLEMATVLKAKGAAAVRPFFENADVVDRSAHIAATLAPEGDAGVAWLRRELRTLDGDPRTLAELTLARRAAGDATAGPDLADRYAPRAKALVAADRAKPARADAGTLILDREERYTLTSDGFVRAEVWDVRRLGGTSDVEANASARVATTSSGIGQITQTVHRIFKQDGSVVEPDRIAASQAGAELSQIEPGDYVELVAEGWLAARADGSFDLDTPDVLPPRTAVAHATITLATPKVKGLQIWAHPELGPPIVAETGEGAVTSRTWTVADRGVRRTERGQTPLDAQVAVRLSSWGWERLSRDARDGVLADDERIPEVSAWVASAAGPDRTPSLELLARLAKASKRAIPRVGFLPLPTGAITAPQTYTARTVLLDSQGSRVALVHRALDELGIANEIVWAEQSPYSTDPDMVPRPWRFSHALLVAHLAAHPVARANGPRDRGVWLDLDVDGVPPPPGRTSPELRGRSAVDTHGAVFAIPPNEAVQPDHATIDLVVDETGRARGSLALLLRGRDAQDLSAILEEQAGAEREEDLRAYVLGWMPHADVLEVKASAETWQVVLMAKVELPIALTPDAGRLALAGIPPLHGGGRASTLGGRYASQASRTTAFAIPDAVQYAIHRVVRFPSGTSFTTPFPAVDVTDATTSLRATRKLRVEGSTLIDDLGFSLPTGVVPAARLDTFTAAARAVDDGFQAVVRVSTPAARTTPAGRPAGASAPKSTAAKAKT